MKTIPKLQGENLNDYGARLKTLFSEGKISEEEYYFNEERECSSLYLSRKNPRAQSGHGSDIFRWRNIRWMILEAVYHEGTFIDIGAANGHLIETLDAWMRCTGVQVEFYGLEISQSLYDLARKRMPSFESRLFLGNALDWNPPFQFDYVYSMILPDIPDELKNRFLANLYNNILKPGGRMILGPWNNPELERVLAQAGYTPDGYCEKTVPGNMQEIKRFVWFDKAP